MRIDVHAHYWTEDYIDLLTGLGKADAGAARGIGAGGGAELAARLRLTDRAGVQMQALSACPQSPYGQDGNKATRAARLVNDRRTDGSDVARCHPTGEPTRPCVRDKRGSRSALVTLPARRARRVQR